jgi:cation diffusion facilitator family transporter
VALQTHASEKNLQTGARIALLGLIVNVVLASAKILAGIFGNAYVLIADGIESALDIGGSIVIWGGLKFASRPPDATHPYGHGKAEPIAAAAVSLGVLTASVGLAVQSVYGLFHPHPAPAAFTLLVLIAAVITKEVLFRYVIDFGLEIDSTAIKTDAWHHRFDAIVSAAAFIAISIALLGGEKWRKADEWAALFACAVIATNGVRLFWPALREIMDTAPRREFVDSIRKTAASIRGVVDVENCRIRKMGVEFHVDLHARVDGSISVREGHEIAHEVKRAIQQNDRRIADVLVHIEPAK